MSGFTPWQRLRDNVTEVVGMCFLAVFVSSFFVGQMWLLGVGLVGMLVITPLVALLFGDEDDIAEWWDEDDAESVTLDDRKEPDPLDELRRRYARGEISDEEFERRLERLLETESMADIEQYGLSNAGEETSTHTPEAELERS